MSHNRKTLLTLAAERRVVGHSWDSIAKELQRKPKTCQNWPAKYRSEWEPIYREIQQRRFEQTSNECHTRLIALTRHADPKVQQKAIELWVKSCAATYGRNGTMTLPASSVSAPTHNQQLMDGVLEDMEYARQRMDVRRSMQGLPPTTDEEFFEEWERELDAVAAARSVAPFPAASRGEGTRSNGAVMVGLLLLAALIVQRPTSEPADASIISECGRRKGFGRSPGKPCRGSPPGSRRG